MDQDDEKISMLLGMGFPDVQAIKHALRMSNGDMNDAVTYLTEKPLSSYTTVDDLRDVDMPDAGGNISIYDSVSISRQYLKIVIYDKIIKIVFKINNYPYYFIFNFNLSV